MSQREVVKYWRDSAKETLSAAEDNFQSRHYDWAFFLWHLAIEKLMKGLVAKRGLTPLPVHDLLKLAKSARVKLNSDQELALKEITTYAIEARYDDYKRSFYKKVTQKYYREPWRTKCREISLWLQKLY